MKSIMIKSIETLPDGQRVRVLFTQSHLSREFATGCENPSRFRAQNGVALVSAYVPDVPNQALDQGLVYVLGEGNKPGDTGTLIFPDSNDVARFMVAVEEYNQTFGAPVEVAKTSTQAPVEAPTRKSAGKASPKWPRCRELDRRIFALGCQAEYVRAWLIDNGYYPGRSPGMYRGVELYQGQLAKQAVLALCELLGPSSPAAPSEPAVLDVRVNLAPNGKDFEAEILAQSEWLHQRSDLLVGLDNPNWSVRSVECPEWACSIRRLYLRGSRASQDTRKLIIPAADLQNFLAAVTAVKKLKNEAHLPEAITSAVVQATMRRYGLPGDWLDFARAATDLVLWLRSHPKK